MVCRTANVAAVDEVAVTDDAAIRWTQLPGSDPVLVVLHGLGASSVGHFLHVVTDPGFAARRVLFVDLLGFGFSDRPTDFDYSIHAHAESVARVVHHLDRGPVDVVGHSLGGSIAIHLAHAHPQLVRRLVAIEPNLDPWDGTASVDIARQTEGEFLADGMQALLRSAGPAWRSTLRLADPVALHRTALGLCLGSTPVIRRSMLELTLPRTLIWGELSHPPAGLEELRAAGVGYSVVPASGHVPMEDNPAFLARALHSCLLPGPVCKDRS